MEHDKQLLNAPYVDGDPATMFHAAMQLLPYFMVVGLIAIAVVNTRIKHASFLMAIGIAFVISYVLKKIIKEPRPEGVHKDGYGMPSNHSAFALVFTVIFLHRLWVSIIRPFWIKPVLAFLIILFAILNLWSRVAYRVHTPAQCAVGSLIGLVVGLLWILIEWKCPIDRFQDILDQHLSIHMPTHGDKTTMSGTRQKWLSKEL